MSADDINALPCESDPAFWFNEGATTEPRRICNTECPAANGCLLSAMRYESGESAQYRFGVWGGMTAGQRARLDRTWLGARLANRPLTTQREAIARTGAA